MVFKFCLFLILTCYGVNKVYGQEGCVPNTVLVLLISSNATLSWVTHPREPCEITEYLVEIVGDREDSYVFSVTNEYVDISFLEVCEEWIFTVTPLSYDTKGYSRSITAYIPLPDEADLSLSYFNVSHNGGRDVLLEWDLNDHSYGDCTLQYRITIEDEDLGVSQSFYVSDKSVHFSVLSPCVEYDLSIRAINRAYPTVEGPLTTSVFELPAEPQEPPILQDVATTATSINLVWVLEGGTNRCPLKSLHIDSGTNFNISLPLMNSLDPEPIPVDLSNLQPDSMYFLKVAVENNAGLSRPTQIGVQTLPLS